MSELGETIWNKRREGGAWHACVDCGKEQWVRLRHSKFVHQRCNHCAKLREHNPRYGLRGELCPNWTGGQTLKEGYILIYQPTHPRAGSNGYVKRALLVLEEKLGRPMAWWMVSHHINGFKDDDRPENLEEISINGHHVLHAKGQERTPEGRFC